MRLFTSVSYDVLCSRLHLYLQLTLNWLEFRVSSLGKHAFEMSQYPLNVLSQSDHLDGARVHNILSCDGLKKRVVKVTKTSTENGRIIKVSGMEPYIVWRYPLSGGRGLGSQGGWDRHEPRTPHQHHILPTAPRDTSGGGGSGGGGGSIRARVGRQERRPPWEDGRTANNTCSPHQVHPRYTFHHTNRRTWHTHTH